jgi:hypothetical protein
MRRLTILLLTTICISATGQSLTGKYNAYYGHSLELKDDSTFKYEWRFDLIKNWAVGQWTFSKDIVTLNFVDVYDTLVRPDKPDSLVLSLDDKSSKINIEEYGSTQLVSGGQHHSDITDRLIVKRKRLYLMDNNGRPSKVKQRGIWTKKKRPTYYFRVD